MHCMYKQIHPPTGIENCVYAHFFNWEEKNLIVAGVNHLHVYRLNSEPEVCCCMSILNIIYHITLFVFILGYLLKLVISLLKSIFQLVTPDGLLITQDEKG